MVVDKQSHVMYLQEEIGRYKDRVANIVCYGQY